MLLNFSFILYCFLKKQEWTIPLHFLIHIGIFNQKVFSKLLVLSKVKLERNSLPWHGGEAWVFCVSRLRTIIWDPELLFNLCWCACVYARSHSLMLLLWGWCQVVLGCHQDHSSVSDKGWWGTSISRDWIHGFEHAQHVLFHLIHVPSLPVLF